MSGAGWGHEPWGVWLRILPAALLTIAGIWWISDYSSRHRIIGDLTAARTQAEAAATKARADLTVAANKATTDLDSAAVKLRTEVAAREKAEGEAGALKGRFDAQGKKLSEVEASLAKARKDLEEAAGRGDAAVASVRADLGAATSRIQKAEADTKKAEADTGAWMARHETESKAKRKLEEDLTVANAELSRLKTRLEAETKRASELESARATSGKDSDAAMTKLRADFEAANARAQKADADLVALRVRLDDEAKVKQKLTADTSALSAELAAWKTRYEDEVRAKKKLEAQSVATIAVAKTVDPKPAQIPVCGAAVKETAVAVRGQIRFQSGSAILTASSAPALERVITAIKSCPDTRIRVEGHTDSDNANGLNQPLSEQRANAVRQRLIEAGIDGTRLTAVGFGHSQPIKSPELTGADKALNRRIDFVVEAN